MMISFFKDFIFGNYNLKFLAEIIGAKMPIGLDGELKYKRVLTQSQYVEAGDIVISAGWYASEKLIRDSLEKGAIAVFCSRDDKKNFPEPNVVAVDDPMKCVQKYEKWILDKYKLKTVTITGSVGKTTTTGFVNHVFSNAFKTFYGHSMANSHGAILRNIQKLNKSYEWWVQEVGGVQPGYIQSSAKVLNSDIVIITNIGDSHLDKYKTKDNIFVDKSSLEKYSKSNATVIISYDDEILRNGDYSHKVITCSLNNNKADWYAKNIITTYNGISFNAECQSSGESIYVKISLFGEHNVLDALFAIAAGRLANIPIENIVKSIEEYKPSGMRQNFVNIGGYHLMIDVFNAEPKTVLGSALTLTQMPSPKGRKIFVTGHIDKLGSESPILHEHLGIELSKLDIDKIVLYAGDSKYTYRAIINQGKTNAIYFDARTELDNWIRENVSREDIIFFKSGQFEAALVKTIDNVFGTNYQNEQQYNNGEIVIKNGYKIRLRKDCIAEIEGYIGKEVDLIIPEEYESIPIVRIRPFAFHKNKIIKSVKIPDTVVNIGQEAFFECTNIRKIELPLKLKFIGKNAFNYNKELRSIHIPYGTIHIDRHAFFDCISLEEIYIPDSIGFWGEDVFGISDNLKRKSLLKMITFFK